MKNPEEDRKLLKAIDCIIRDVDKKYDECLVDHFLESIQSNNQDSTTTMDDWFKTTEPILDRLKSYLDHKAFVMMNQARAYKTFQVFMRERYLFEGEFTENLSNLNSLWNTLDIVVINENLSAVTILLSFFEQICHTNHGREWLCTNTIEPPLKLIKKGCNYEIKDIFDLTEFYIETCNNYHTTKKAELLFISLMVNSIPKNITSSKQSCNKQLIERIDKTLRRLIKRAPTSIIEICLKLLADYDEKSFLKELSCYYNLSEIIFTHFLAISNNPTANFNQISKCLALMNSYFNFTSPDKILDPLKTLSKIEAIIIFLTNSIIRDVHLYQELLFYSFMPLLLNCQEDDIKDLESRICFEYRHIDEQEDKLKSDKLVTTSLVNMDKNLTTFYRFSCDMLVVEDILSSFIKCQMEKTTKNHRNISLAQKILSRVKSNSLGESLESEEEQTSSKETLNVADLAGERMKKSSLVDDIINYELISDGISDCY